MKSNLAKLRGGFSRAKKLRRVFASRRSASIQPLSEDAGASVDSPTSHADVMETSSSTLFSCSSQFQSLPPSTPQSRHPTDLSDSRSESMILRGMSADSTTPLLQYHHSEIGSNLSESTNKPWLVYEDATASNAMRLTLPPASIDECEDSEDDSVTHTVRPSASFGGCDV